jgi:hypothetical protein
MPGSRINRFVVYSALNRAARTQRYPMDDLEALWEALLSQNPGQIRRAWMALSDDEALAVLQHLGRIRDEDGWQPSQREAAAAALQVIYDQAQ